MPDLARLARKITSVLFATQSLAAARLLPSYATSSLGSGFLFAMSGYTLVALVSAGLSLIPMLLAINLLRRPRLAAQQG